MSNIIKEQSFTDDVIVRSVKIVDITYITLIYFTFGYIFAMSMDRYYGQLDFNEEKKKSTLRLLVEICLNFAIIGISSYIARNLTEVIPFPLDGIKGFNHKLVKELHNVAPIYMYIVMFYQENLKTKMMYVKNRILSGKEKADLILDNTISGHTH